jgi:hypothetical protein
LIICPLSSVVRYRKIKITVRERFAGKREMPPLARVGTEAASAHRFRKESAIAARLLAYVWIGRPRLRAEEIERCAHIEFAAEFAAVIEANEGEVDRRPARMAGPARNIAISEQVAFVQTGIELGFVFDVGEVVCPAHEMRDRLCRPVAVEDLETKPARCEIAFDRGKCDSRRARQEASRRLIAVDPGADEIVAAEIAHLDHEPGHRSCGVNKSGGLRRGSGRAEQRHQRQRNSGEGRWHRRFHRLLSRIDAGSGRGHPPSPARGGSPAYSGRGGVEPTGVACGSPHPGAPLARLRAS